MSDMNDKTILLKNCSSQDLVKRTPSTSAIYETLRRWNDHHLILIIIIGKPHCNYLFTLVVFRSKELRESLSRPSSRLSCENGMEKMGKDVVRIIIEIITKMNVVDNCNHPDYNGNDQGRRDIWPNQCVHHLAAVIPTCRQVPQDPADPCLTRPTSLLFHHHDILIYHRIVIYHIWNIDDI